MLGFLGHNGGVGGVLGCGKQRAKSDRSPRPDAVRLRKPRKEKEDDMSERLTVPVLPLRETVISPGTAVPISAGRPGTLEAIETALAGDRRMFAVAQRENKDDVEPENLFTVGTLVRVAQVQRGAG